MNTAELRKMADAIAEIARATRAAEAATGRTMSVIEAADWLAEQIEFSEIEDADREAFAMDRDPR